MTTLMRFNIFLIFLLIYGYIFTRFKKIKDKKMIKEYINLSYIISIIFIIALTIFPVTSSFKLDLNINLIPFKTVFHFISKFDLIELLFNILGNIIMFVPFGFFLYFKERGDKKITLIACLLLTVSVEITQLILPERTTDIDDVILNFLGGYIGVVLANKFKTSYENIP
ncbi:VanZ family protein [Terrisporobacter sp.]